MAECFIVRRGGQTYQLPELDSSWPQDVTVVASASGSASFTVQITQPGTPAEYTYKWYKDGSAIASATAASVTIAGLTEAASHTVYCEVTNKAGTVTSRVATLTVKDWLPVYAYTGNATLLNDGSYSWRIKFLTSGVLTFSSLGNADSLDVFLVGGGGGNCYGVGGCGGNTKTVTGASAVTGQDYPITIGAGGAAINAIGGSTSAFGAAASGGASSDAGGTGSGGGGGTDSWSTAGDGGSDGGYGKGKNNSGTYCAGQGTTTREFGESTGQLYSGGGGGYGTSSSGKGGAGGGADAYQNAAANTGGGAGGTTNRAARSGGSGIVVIRNHR